LTPTSAMKRPLPNIQPCSALEVRRALLRAFAPAPL
jgi:hypothetical protein